MREETILEGAFILMILLFVALIYIEVDTRNNGTTKDMCKLECKSWGKVNYTCVKDCLTIKGE
jgi:hypothetical protein